MDLFFLGNWRDRTTSLVFRDLAAELSLQDIGVCRDGERDGALISTVSVSRHGSRAVRIEVVDSLTNKQVTRDIEVQGDGESAHALIIFVAIHELLRATWAELSLEPKQETRLTETRATLRAQEPEPAQTAKEPSRAPLHLLGIGATVDVFPLGSTFWGAELSYSRSVASWLEWRLALGASFHRSSERVRSSEAESAQDESSRRDVTARAASATTTFAAPLLRSKGFSLGPQASFAATLAWFRGAAGDSTGTTQDVGAGSARDVVLSLRGGLFLRQLLGPLYLQAQTEIGAPVLGFEVTDGNERVGGLLGLQSSSRVTVGVFFE